MSAQTDNAFDYEAVTKTIRSWPTQQRFMLVQEVLASLAADAQESQQRQPTLARARGLLATQNPAPLDEDVEVLLAERRQERFGL